MLYLVTDTTKDAMLLTPHYMLNHNFTPKSVWKKIGNLFLHRMRVKLLSVEKMSISTFLYYLLIYCELSSIFNPRICRLANHEDFLK